MVSRPRKAGSGLLLCLVLTTAGKALTQLHTWRLSNRGTVQRPSPAHSRSWEANDTSRGSAEAEVRAG